MTYSHAEFGILFSVVVRERGPMRTVLEIASQNAGYVTAAQVTAAGIPRRKLAEVVRSGEVVQLTRGLYALPDVWEDPLYIAQYRFSRGVFSDDTALNLHEMTDHTPASLTMTFPRNYNTAAVKDAGIICRTCANEVLDLGLTQVKTIYGNMVRVYDLERTLCDLMRGKSVLDMQLLVPAMQSYTRSKDRDLVKRLFIIEGVGVVCGVRRVVAG